MVHDFYTWYTLLYADDISWPYIFSESRYELIKLETVLLVYTIWYVLISYKV